MTLGANMAKQEANYEVLAGAGGVSIGEARTNHQGRRALLLVRGLEDTNEFCQSFVSSRPRTNSSARRP